MKSLKKIKIMKIKILILHICLLLVLQLSYTESNAQIEYYNISPDTLVSKPDTIGTNYYNIDLNSDGIVDFSIGAEYSQNNELTRVALDNYIVKINTDTLNRINAGPHFDGDTINQVLNFLNSNWIYCILPGQGIIGPWPGIINSVDTYGYIGLEFHKDGNIHYGWVRLKTDGESFSIDSYAWNKTTGQLIVIGQTE